MEKNPNLQPFGLGTCFIEMDSLMLQAIDTSQLQLMDQLIEMLIFVGSRLDNHEQ